MQCQGNWFRTDTLQAEKWRKYTIHSDKDLLESDTYFESAGEIKIQRQLSQSAFWRRVYSWSKSSIFYRRTVTDCKVVEVGTQKIMEMANRNRVFLSKLNSESGVTNYKLIQKKYRMKNLKEPEEHITEKRGRFSHSNFFTDLSYICQK